MSKPNVFVRSAYNYDVDKASDEAATVNLEPSLAKQSFKDECDINTIARNFNLTGELPSGVSAPVYADFNEIFDFHSAMNAVAKAHEAFDLMPADVRARFQNDPGEFVAFCDDDANRAEAERLGLVFKPVPVPAPGVGEPGAPPVSPAPVVTPETGG